MRCCTSAVVQVATPDLRPSDPSQSAVRLNPRFALPIVRARLRRSDCPLAREEPRIARTADLSLIHI
eukprot:8211776-Alexandrium_andersonii.AAC.1